MCATGRGSAIPLISLDSVHKYHGRGKAGISVAGFQAQESGLHDYEIMVDRLAWEKFAKEFGWSSEVVEAVNKIVIREAGETESSFWMNIVLFLVIFVGIVGIMVYGIYQARKKR